MFIDIHLYNAEVCADGGVWAFKWTGQSAAEVEFN